MRKSDSACRVVITGVGLICPLGHDLESLWSGLRNKQSAVDTMTALPRDAFAFSCAAEARSFTGQIGDFGPLDKKTDKAIRKGLKLMCREIEMGVAAAQHALLDAGLSVDQRDADRTGVLFGSDYIMTLPDEFTIAINKCRDASGNFDFESWATLGMPHVNPLWLLKYLPNMPASHIAIYNDLRGANNSLTMRDASPGAAIGEAVSTISRGIVDAMVVGATGTRINPFRTLHVAMQEIVAVGSENPTSLSRPFDKDRTGSVLGEGAGVMILEDLEFAKARGANILGEVVGFGSSTVGPRDGQPFIKMAMSNVLEAAMRRTDKKVGHINAHGISTPDGDAQEAAAIVEVFGRDNSIPVVAPKANFGNLGAGGGMVEAIASVKALNEGTLWPTLNYETPDDDCPLNVTTSCDVPAGDSFVSLNITPQGQATAFRIAKYSA